MTTVRALIACAIIDLSRANRDPNVTDAELVETMQKRLEQMKQVMEPTTNTIKQPATPAERPQ